MTKRLTASILAIPTALSVAVALTAAPAGANGGYGPKVDARLAAQLAQAKGGDRIAVIVLSRDGSAGDAQPAKEPPKPPKTEPKKDEKKKNPKPPETNESSGGSSGQTSGPPQQSGGGPSRPRIALGFMNGQALEVAPADVPKLAADPDVVYVAADVPVAPLGRSSDGFSAYAGLAGQYAALDGALAARKAGLDGRGVGIAVVDSGVARVSDFAGRLHQIALPGQKWPVTDAYGHGTLVAGIAAGRGRITGIAPRAKIYAINIDRPGGPRSSDAIEAIGWILKNASRLNIRVANLSIGETVPSSYRQSLLDLGVERLWAAGVFVVVSAGNRGAGQVDFAPANDPLAVAVGATDTHGTLDARDDSPANFSSSGKTFDGFAKPNLLAPGRLVAGVLAPQTALAQLAPARNVVAPGYAAISGTSFAAPQVAGAAAVAFQKHPSWSPDQVKWLLVRHAVPLAHDGGRALRLGFLASYRGVPSRANQGVPALVCAPGTQCVGDGTVASRWNSSGWSQQSWQSGAWASTSWNSTSWNSTSWNSTSWNSTSWNSTSWNSTSWNSTSWNAFSWE